MISEDEIFRLAANLYAKRVVDFAPVPNGQECVEIARSFAKMYEEFAAEFARGKTDVGLVSFEWQCLRCAAFNANVVDASEVSSSGDVEIPHIFRCESCRREWEMNLYYVTKNKKTLISAMITQ